MRTGKIGLRAFLYAHWVPGAESPLCQCGIGNETAYHVVVQCLELERERKELQRQLGDGFLTDRANFARATSDSRSGQAMARWLLRLGRLIEYRLAVRLARDGDQEEG